MGRLAPILGMENRTVPAKELTALDIEAEIAGIYIDVMMRNNPTLKYKTPTIPSDLESAPLWALN